MARAESNRAHTSWAWVTLAISAVVTLYLVERVTGMLVANAVSMSPMPALELDMEDFVDLKFTPSKTRARARFIRAQFSLSCSDDTVICTDQGPIRTGG